MRTNLDNCRVLVYGTPRHNVSFASPERNHYRMRKRALYRHHFLLREAFMPSLVVRPIAFFSSCSCPGISVLFAGENEIWGS